MSHDWALEGDFFARLAQVDEQIGAEVQAQGCQRCDLGGRLHRSDYPRKPRGVPASAEASWSRRVSLRCNRCRLRTTPPSVRFLGRRVYAGAVFVVAALATAMTHATGVPVRTLGRWRRWWERGLRRTRAWRDRLRAQLPPGLHERGLPLSLVEHLTGEPLQCIETILHWLMPLTTTSFGSQSARAM